MGKASISLRGLGPSNPNLENPLLRQAYINLLKASWILTDIISVHPSLSHDELQVRIEVMQLTEVRVLNAPVPLFNIIHSFMELYL